MAKIHMPYQTHPQREEITNNCQASPMGYCVAMLKLLHKYES